MVMLVGWVGVKSPGYAGHFGGGDQPHPANRYGGSWVGLTLWTPPKGMCANALGCGCEPGWYVGIGGWDGVQSPGYAGHSGGRGPTPPCEPLWRLLGGANVVDAPKGAMR